MHSLARDLKIAAAWARAHRLRFALLAALWALALLSIVQGFRNALQYSTDFQWSPARLLSEGVNPYEVTLSGHVDGRILLSQYPPYQHLLYIVMLPLASLPYGLAKGVWAALNLGFATASLVLLTRRFRLSAVEGALLAALFFLSTPYRNGLGNGQTSLLCLTAFLLAWDRQTRNPARAGVSLSLLLTKYSFAPPICLWFLLRGRLAMLLSSLALLTAGWLLFAGICRENPLEILAQPLKVAALHSESEGGGDIMTLAQSFGLDTDILGPLRLSALLGLAAACAGVALLWRRAGGLSEAECLAALCLVSLMSIRHLAYDFVFLAPVAACAFSLPRRAQTCVIVALLYLGFGLKLLVSLDIAGKWAELASFLALALMLFLIVFPARRSSSAPAPLARGA